MVTLLTYPAALGQPSVSPFCVKAMHMLNLAGVPWEREDTSDPRKMPYGKLPVLRVDGNLIADSDEIRAYLADQGKDLDAHLSPRDQSVARAFTRMAEEHLYFQLLHDRWVDPKNWTETRAANFSTVPAMMRSLVANSVRKHILKGLHFKGLARLSPQERLDRADQDLRAILAQLDGAPFLFGDRPCSADISVAAMLGGLASTPHPTPLQARVAQDPALVSYVDRVTTACAG
ncbi:MAG: glutathione S-transferase family protein [Rhodobacteraceae bacterium]|nr:glutathione S-transferase family protein [Paracoccaceae bacterium]